METPRQAAGAPPPEIFVAGIEVGASAAQRPSALPFLPACGAPHTLRRQQPTPAVLSTRWNPTPFRPAPTQRLFREWLPGASVEGSERLALGSIAPPAWARACAGGSAAPHGVHGAGGVAARGHLHPTQLQRSACAAASSPARTHSAPLVMLA
jgi:hypothetical protein